MAFDFPFSGARSPQGVKLAIRAYRRLPLAVRQRLPLLWYLLPEGTPPYKFTKAEAAYQPVPKGRQQCDNCRSAYRHVVTGYLICDQMRGIITASAWCRVWRPPPDPAAYVAYQER